MLSLFSRSLLQQRSGARYTVSYWIFLGYFKDIHIYLSPFETTCTLTSHILSANQMKRIHLSSSPSIMNTLKSLCIQILAELSDPHHRIRAACIRLLALLSSIINRSNDAALSSQGSSKTESTAETSATAFTSTTLSALKGMEIQTVISNYVMDADARVRGVCVEHQFFMLYVGLSLIWGN